MWSQVGCSEGLRDGQGSGHRLTHQVTIVGSAKPSLGGSGCPWRQNPGSPGLALTEC